MSDKQIQSLIRYHEGIAANAKLYDRPTEGVLEEMTVKYLKELDQLKEKEKG